VLERSIAELGIYPAVDPLASTSKALAPEVVGEEHYDVARGVQRVLQRYKDLQDIIAILGMDELSPKTNLCASRAKNSALLESNHFTLPKSLPAPKANTSRLPRRFEGSKEIFGWQTRRSSGIELLHEGRNRSNRPSNFRISKFRILSL